jgi:hypothetical protein
MKSTSPGALRASLSLIGIHDSGWVIRLLEEWYMVLPVYRPVALVKSCYSDYVLLDEWLQECGKVATAS